MVIIEIIMFAATTALIMCFVASLVEDFVLPYRSRKPREHWNPIRAFWDKESGNKPT